MDIHQESASEFVVGHGGADVVSKPIVASGYARKAYKGVHVRAAVANTIVIYVGPQGVSDATGYPLPAGEEITIPVDNPSKVHVVATPAGNSQQVVTLSGMGLGDTFTLTFEGATTSAIAYDAAASTVKAALEGLATIGTGNVDVTGSAGGPYTVEFKGTFAKRDVSLMAGTVTNGTITITNTDASEGSQYRWFAV
jgi:hypothetical protein